MHFLAKMLLWTFIALAPGGFLLLPLALRRSAQPRAAQVPAAA
jgi:hypothetical protein